MRAGDTAWPRERRRESLQRAAFDLDCPAEELLFTSLDSADKQVPRKWGVQGCGRKASYVDLGERELDVPGNWVLESEDVSAQ